MVFEHQIGTFVYLPFSCPLLRSDFPTWVCERCCPGRLPKLAPWDTPGAAGSQRHSKPRQRPEPLLNLLCNSGDKRCESPLGPGQAIHLWMRVPGFQTPASEPLSSKACSPSRASLSQAWPCTLVSWRASAGEPFRGIQPLPNQRARFRN